MPDREKILKRIRAALTAPAHRPGQHDPTPTATDNTVGTRRRCLPKVGTTFGEWVEQFRANAEQLKANFVLVDSRAELLARLRALRQSENWQQVASHPGQFAESACAEIGVPILRVAPGCDPHALERCDAGVTECDALIAQTGSVLVTSRSAGGRALSVLPPHHVVIARREQLLPDLPAAFALLKEKYAPDYPSMISFITGPSRTGDIERVLVLGAHGPRKLTVFCF